MERRDTGQVPGEHASLRRKLWEAVASATPEKQYRPDRERQRAVFDSVDWPGFEREVMEGLRETKSAGAGKMLRGKLFEMLIQADPTFGQRSELERELLTLAHSPEKYGLGKELGHHRNPDLAFLIVEDDEGIVITGVGESKLGLLNERSFKQLSETGFMRGVTALVEVVNGIDDLQAHGLIELSRVKTKLKQDQELIRVADSFSQLLVVPANRNIEWASTLLNRREFSAEGRKKFYALLEDETKVRTARAAFSTAEVTAMTNVLTSK